MLAPSCGKLDWMPAFYTQVDENTFDSSADTAGPWSPDTQHGGPPSALLTRQIERFNPREGHRLARVAVDILKPVPVGRLHTRVTSLQRGRRVELLEATAANETETVLIARAWRIETTPPDVPERRSDGDGPAGRTHEPTPQTAQTAGFRTDGYLAAIDWSFERGTFNEYGPAKVWARPRLPLVAGEEMSGWQRAMTLADSGSGISMVYSPTEHPAINTDVIVSLDRDPDGEWIGMDAETTVAARSGAMTRTELFDQHGSVGLATQSLLIGRRPQ